MVERCPEKAGVGSSILPLGTIKLKSHSFFGWLFNLIALGRIEQCKFVAPARYEAYIASSGVPRQGRRGLGTIIF